MTRPADTTPEAWEVQRRILRAMSGAERVSMALEMSETAREVTKAGIRHRHPDWGDEEIHNEFLRVTLGEPLATKVIASRPKA